MPMARRMSTTMRNGKTGFELIFGSSASLSRCLLVLVLDILFCMACHVVFLLQWTLHLICQARVHHPSKTMRSCGISSGRITLKIKVSTNAWAMGSKTTTAYEGGKKKVREEEKRGISDASRTDLASIGICALMQGC